MRKDSSDSQQLVTGVCRDYDQELRSSRNCNKYTATVGAGLLDPFRNAVAGK